MSLEMLIATQNRDGGWPYVRGVSWTEPTAFAVLAMLATGQTERARRGLAWLNSMQRTDGGWAPQAQTDQSTWVTALAALIPPEHLGRQSHAQAIRWLASVTGEESTLLYRVREWLLGESRDPDQAFPGWPWVPGTAAWVAPTTFAILALDQECRRSENTALRQRVEAGRHFLLLHMCREGGWNHGSVRPLGFESRPYPETTGLALAGLRGVASPEIARALNRAKRFYAECHSPDAFNWLRLGLLAHNALPEARPGLQPRTILETAVDQIANAAVGGRNWIFA